MKNISILGVTGSIGMQAIELIRQNKNEYNLLGFTANKSVDKVKELIEEFNPKYVAMMDETSAREVENYCSENNKNTVVKGNIEGLNEVATIEEVEMVLTSVVGMVGLIPTIKAIKAGKDIALANKETLVAAGHIVMKEAKENNVKILPVDSEHSAIFQCLQGNELKDVSTLHVTASGGPFRGRAKEELKDITPEDAVKHPTWSMGKKISVDSSTLMNKGLEVIEAHWLFGVNYDDINVVVHPESIVHSAVEYKDGSIIAQLSKTDMKLPIQYAFNYPKREESVIEPFNFFAQKKLTFEEADSETFECLRLAYEAGKKGGNMTAILNSANEEAVELFLNNKINYLDIPKIIKECMNTFEFNNEPTLDEILELDKDVRKYIKSKFN